MLKIIKISVILGIFSAAIFGQIAQAENVPDAGSILRDIEKLKEPPEPKKNMPTAVNPTLNPGTDNPTKMMVTVNSFRFTGNTLVETDVLQKALVGYTKRPLTFDEIQAATARVAEIYRQAGWVARPNLPPQDVSKGEVNIVIVEATFGVTRINRDEPRRISSQHLIAIIKSEQPKGQFINAKALDNALRRINELPGIQVNGVLKAGEHAGETDLVLSVEETPLVSGNVSLDNAGSKFTGEERLIASASLNSPFGFSERFSAMLLYSEGTTFGQLGASMPVGYDGWQIGSHASALNYSLNKDFGVLGVEGSSSAVGLDANYPLLRSRDKNLSFAMSYEATNFKNQDTLLGESEYAVGGLSAALSGQYFDDLGGVNGGINQATLGFVNGSVDDKTGKLPASVSDHFNKIRYSINRQQHLTDRFSLYGSFTGQWADSNLTSSEKFTLGGTSGVRAYRSSEGSGDLGQLLSAELRVRLPYGVGVAAFVDAGTVTAEKDPKANAINNRYTLSGTGLSARWQSKFGVNLKATWAKPIGKNKSANADSEQGKDLIWLQASMNF